MSAHLKAPVPSVGLGERFAAAPRPELENVGSARPWVPRPARSGVVGLRLCASAELAAVPPVGARQLCRGPKFDVPRAAAERKNVVLLDYNTRADVGDVGRRLSHAFLVARYITDD